MWTKHLDIVVAVNFSQGAKILYLDKHLITGLTLSNANIGRVTLNQNQGVGMTASIATCIIMGLLGWVSN